MKKDHTIIETAKAGDAMYTSKSTNIGVMERARIMEGNELVDSVSCDDITSIGLTALWAANPNLMDVDFTNDKYLFEEEPEGNECVSDDDIIQLVQCCPLLQKLNIFNCWLITDAAVIAVAEHCPHLRSLNISGCEVSDASLIALGQNCHELKSISISDLNDISDVGIAALAAGCPLLQGFYFYANNTNITDAGVVALARGCRDLFKVSLRECKYLGFASVSAIAEHCPLISKLLLHSYKIDDACLYVIAQHCRNLTVLDISSSKIIEADAIRAVLESCLQLTMIDARGCSKLRDKESIRNHQKKHPRLMVLLSTTMIL